MWSNCYDRSTMNGPRTPYKIVATFHNIIHWMHVYHGKTNALQCSKYRRILLVVLTYPTESLILEKRAVHTSHVRHHVAMFMLIECDDSMHFTDF